MQITLHNVGKRFNLEWIFRHVDINFVEGNCYAITGSNGSGKSTLLQVIAGNILHNEGSIDFTHTNPSDITEEERYQQIAIVAPYLELIEEMTATELLDFHSSFKALMFSSEEILKKIGLQQAAHKQIRYYSSGMKQRLKLALAFFSSVPILLLDEPCTNLDSGGVELYHDLIHQYTSNRLVIVCSNDKNEYDFCTEIISIEKYKKIESTLA